jgi:hypothetical protein
MPYGRGLISDISGFLVEPVGLRNHDIFETCAFTGLVQYRACSRENVQAAPYHTPSGRDMLNCISY